jgi:lysozyme family protein
MSRFDECLPLVLKHEGGYVNNRHDPGGATNKGITQKTYDAWSRRQGKSPRSVQHITDAEVAVIYRRQYWDAVRADDLPVGLDYAVFDFAVNSGPRRAAQFLQRVVRVADDGIIGEQTLDAIGGFTVPGVISTLCDNRLAWLKRLKTWRHFGRGWQRRVNEVKGAALNMAQGMGYQEPVGQAEGRADGPEKVTASIEDMVRDPKVWAGAGGLFGSLGGLLTGNGPVQYALAAVIVLGAAVLAYKLVKRS